MERWIVREWDGDGELLREFDGHDVTMREHRWEEAVARVKAAGAGRVVVRISAKFSRAYSPQRGVVESQAAQLEMALVAEGEPWPRLS